MHGTGIDVVEKHKVVASEIARVVGVNAEFVLESAEEFARPGEFDFIIHLGTLYHLANPVRSIENCARSLKPGGWFALETTCYRGSPDPMLSKWVYGFQGDESNFWALGEGAIESMAKNAGIIDLVSSCSSAAPYIETRDVARNLGGKTGVVRSLEKERRLVTAVLMLAIFSACAPRHRIRLAPQAKAARRPRMFIPPESNPSETRELPPMLGCIRAAALERVADPKPRANLTMEKPVGAQLATLRFFVPSVAPFRSGQTVTVTVAGATVTGKGSAGHWILVSIGLPAQYVSRTNVPVEITSERSVNPKQLGINEDSRDISVTLQRVEYR